MPRLFGAIGRPGALLHEAAADGELASAALLVLPLLADEGRFACEVALAELRSRAVSGCLDGSGSLLSSLDRLALLLIPEFVRDELKWYSSLRSYLGLSGLSQRQLWNVANDVNTCTCNQRGAERYSVHSCPCSCRASAESLLARNGPSSAVRLGARALAARRGGRLAARDGRGRGGGVRAA